MARARKTLKHISDNKRMKKSVKVLNFRNAEASEQREFIRKRKRDEMERIPHESFELKWRGRRKMRRIETANQMYILQNIRTLLHME